MTFIFDTGSAWTWIPSEDCSDKECTKNHYQYHKSEGFRNTYQKEKVVYGISEISGYVVNDDIAIAPSTKYMATDVNFLSVNKAKDLSTLESDGLMGLSPKSKRSNKGKSGEEMHLLVNELKKDGIIKEAVFAIYLTDTRGQSTMQFGGYDPEIVLDSMKENGKDDASISDAPDGIYWMSINSDVHWQVMIYDAKVGNITLKLTVDDVIFDTGSSLNYMPSKEYQTFYKEITREHYCWTDKKDKLLYCSCNGQNDDTFPSLSMHLGSRKSAHWFYLKGQDYIQYDKYKRNCVVLIMQELKSTGAMWLLGDPFLRAYYSIYDMDAKRLGLVGVAETTRKKTSTQKTMDDLDEAFEDVMEKIGLDPQNQNDIYLIGGGLMLITFICVCCCFQFLAIKYKKKQADQEDANIMRQQEMVMQQHQIEATIKQQRGRGDNDQLQRIAQLQQNQGYGMDNPYLASIKYQGQERHRNPMEVYAPSGPNSPEVIRQQQDDRQLAQAVAASLDPSNLEPPEPGFRVDVGNAGQRVG